MCAIVLIRRSRFTRSCYFADRDLRDRANFSLQGSNPGQTVRSFLLVWPSSVDGDLSDRTNLPIAIMRSCYFADRDVHDCINSPIVIYAIVLFRRSWFMWSCYLVGPGFEPRPNSMIFFIGPGFNSQARSPVSGQCDSWPMSLAPTNGELGWWGEKTSWEEKNARWLC